ncbi:MAG: YSIRK-type signal peptide-containing protein [Limosilactobacillus pontis]
MKNNSRKQQFGIRKLSIGVVSVLLGLLFIGGGNQVAADDQQLAATVDASVVASGTPISDHITASSASTLNQLVVRQLWWLAQQVPLLH